VVTVGGNALVRPGEEGSVQQQYERARTLAGILATLPLDRQLVLTHGNGPQVGQVLLRSELCADQIPPIPVNQAVAATQGQIGTMLQQALLNVAGRPTVTVLTQVVVRDDDPGFSEPTKFIGQFYEEEEAKRRALEFHWVVRRDSDRGWRRVVASPEPLEIVERDAIDLLLEGGITVVACGGGGVPVLRKEGQLVPVEAVVDKDRSTALLAHQVKAYRLVSLTCVDEVQVDFGTPRARDLRDVTPQEMQEHLDAGQFPPGSMGPKVCSALKFLEEGGQEVIITSPERLVEALAGTRGTRIRA
jgi:carbamate kinase